MSLLYDTDDLYDTEFSYDGDDDSDSSSSSGRRGGQSKRSRRRAWWRQWAVPHGAEPLPPAPGQEAPAEEMAPAIELPPVEPGPMLPEWEAAWPMPPADPYAGEPVDWGGILADPVPRPAPEPPPPPPPPKVVVDGGNMPRTVDDLVELMIEARLLGLTLEELL